MTRTVRSASTATSTSGCARRGGWWGPAGAGRAEAGTRPCEEPDSGRARGGGGGTANALSPRRAPLCPQGSRQLQEKSLKISSTLYVGNLSFYTTEEQIQELFSKCGDVKRIVMGLDKIKKTPCGFCFVEYPFWFPAVSTGVVGTCSSSAQEVYQCCCWKGDSQVLLPGTSCPSLHLPLCTPRLTV